MTCEKCGTIYEGQSCPNGCNTPKKSKKPIYKKAWFWIVIAVIGILAATSGNGDSARAEDDSTPKQTVSVQQQEETQEQQQSTEADTAYHVGDVIEANGLKITYTAAEKWEESNQFLQPEEGYMYIRLGLSVENTAESDRYISSLEFTCYADGKKEESYYSGTDPLEGGNLSSGRKDEGYIYFMVPEDAQEIEVEYETSFWTDKKAVLKVELG